jgi:uncharacterized membrane protein YdbT with pleckstrin-like domain
MGYVDGNLIEGERVVYRTPLHWKVLLYPVIFSAVLVVLAILALGQSGSSSADGGSQVFWILGLILLAVAAIPLVKVWIARRSAEFAVTNKRVILKTGLIHNKTAEMFLAKIESVGVDQTIIGRIFGYGSIELRGTGGSLEPFENISQPLEFRRQIQQQIGRSLEDDRGRSEPSRV